MDTDRKNALYQEMSTKPSLEDQAFLDEFLGDEDEEEEVTK